MASTTTTLTAPAGPSSACVQPAATTRGYIIPPDQLDWTKLDWIDAFSHWSQTYERTLLWLANGDGLITFSELTRLLDHHGCLVEEYIQDLADLNAAHPGAAKPVTHVAQALVWLGY